MQNTFRELRIFFQGFGEITALFWKAMGGQTPLRECRCVCVCVWGGGGAQHKPYLEEELNFLLVILSSGPLINIQWSIPGFCIKPEGRII